MAGNGILERSWDSTPPHCLQTERALLGAILVANSSDRKRATKLAPNDFHDPVYRRLFAALKSGRAIARGDRYEAALLMVRIDGEPDCGKVYEIDRYVATIKRLSKLRVRQVWLERELMKILEWQRCS